MVRIRCGGISMRVEESRVSDYLRAGWMRAEDAASDGALVTAGARTGVVAAASEADAAGREGQTRALTSHAAGGASAPRRRARKKKTQD